MDISIILMTWRLFRTLVSALCLYFCYCILTITIVTIIYNNYVQSLTIIKNLTPILARLMIDMEITNANVFDTWIEEEWWYLEDLKRELPLETLWMKYFQQHMASR